MWDTFINAHDNTNSSNIDPKMVAEGSKNMEKLKEEAEGEEDGEMKRKEGEIQIKTLLVLYHLFTCVPQKVMMSQKLLPFS
jgi:hypothetical protein